MKISGMLMLLTALQLSAKTFSQDRLNVDFREKKLAVALKELEKRTEYRFAFSNQVISDNLRVTVSAKDMFLEDVLRLMLSNTGLDFELLDNKLIVIRSAGSQLAFLTVKGRVTDSTGTPLPGVTIAAGKGLGTTTNENGEYQISVDENGQLTFSYIGFLPQTVTVNGRSTIDVVLQSSVDRLSDVVVIGYGNTTKRKLNSAVSTLSMDNVASLPVQSINDAIAGRVHGVIVTRSSGAPGVKSAISIRGGGTPLFVIDNMLRSQNDFENLNPNDIETYSVLKDAAATAIYGARGGNGVILITTKKGKAGQVNINYSYNTIFSQPTLFPKKMGSYDNLKAINDVYIAEGKTPPTHDTTLQFYKDQSKPFIYPNTDWQKIALKDYANEQRHDLSLSSGTKLLTYYASGSYYHQGTNLRTDNNYNDRITYRLNTVSEFEKIQLKVTTGIDGFVEKNSLPNSSTGNGYGALYSHIQNKKPNQLAYNEFGLPSINTTDNPAVELSPLSGYSRNTSRVFNGILGFDWEALFLKGLHFKANGNYNMWNSMSKAWNATAPSYTNGSTTPLLGNPPSLTSGRGDGSTLLLQGFVTYNTTSKGHNIEAMAGYEQANDKSGSLSATRQRYQLMFDQYVAGPTVDQLASGSESESARAGWIGKLGWNYNNKYYVNGTVRYDGNDLLPKEKQWGTFYAFDGGWSLLEEDFLKGIRDRKYLDYLKLRGSYGLTGTLDGIGAFQYVPGYNVNANAWVLNGQPMQGSSEPGSLPSTNFSWYSIRSHNIGMDLATLDNRLTGAVDYFYMRTTGYVTGDTRYSATLGIGLPPVNFDDGAMRREGWEFNLTWNDKIGKDFTYKVGLNFTKFDQLWERAIEDTTAMKNPYTRSSGQSAYLQQGYYNRGFYQNNSDLLYGARRISSINTVAGDLAYEDTNGDGKIDGSDFRNLGSNTFPRINYGVTLDLGYKGITLSAVVMGSGPRDRYLGDVIQGSSAQGILVYDFQKDYWRPDNKDARYPRQVSASGVNGGNNYTGSDFWILKSRFTRLKYLQLGYDLKERLLRHTAVRQFRVFLSGTNLLTISNSKKYFIDPESDTNNYGYPIQRTIALGVNVGF
ncbi:TonB-dependent receptor [Chitinophaga caseinilytica]|uniref:TonB-dependent receptor n=1 Tax=Chitinophaga caseinilytica TaxID=2267521 RepID=A0ABZ2Z0J7_9BACT